MINYIEYLKSDWWITRREKFRKKVKNRCFICRDRNNLQVHHKRYYRKGVSILFREQHTDLRMLCKRCHFFIHEHGYVQKLAAGIIKRKVLRDIILNTT